MQKLYLDCDGVILNTVSNEFYDKLKEMGIDTYDKIREYFTYLDWDKYILESGEIDHACEKIKHLSKFFDVEILTHVNSNNEAMAKKRYFSDKLPMINVNTVPKDVKKGDFICNPKGTILVDDYVDNLDNWASMGGIAVKFSDSGKKSDYITITSLDELVNIDFGNKIRKRKC